ncbi:MAG: LysR family transcriptional regulator [Akkermansiaceae bacterium]|nr:LysR family transcriptional regulator [Akkermansiaceae bacterium]
MELRHIRYFLAVAEELNFTRAAARVGIGQPPLSRQIRDLEEETGAALFLRLPQGVQLSEAGAAFLPEARALLAQAERAREAAQRAARGESGSLRVGFTGSAAFHPRMAVAVRRFRKKHPGVDLQLREEPTAGLLRRLEDGEADVVFVRPGRERPPEGLQMVELEKEPMLLVLPRGFATREAVAVGLGLKAIAQEPLILFPRSAGPGFYEEILGACRRAGFTPVPGQEAPQMTSIAILVAAGLGVSLVPASLAQIQVSGVVYAPVGQGPAPVSRLCAAVREGRMSPALRNFLTLLGPAAVGKE